MCYSLPCVILRYAGFSATWGSMQLIMPFKKNTLVLPTSRATFLCYAGLSATRGSPPSVCNALCPLKKLPCVSNVPYHLRVLLSALRYSPLRGILRYAGFSAFRMQLIMPFKKIPLCQQRPVPPPCVTLRLALFPATRDSRLRGVLRLPYATQCALEKNSLVSATSRATSLCHTPPCVILR